jgi:hypothetical protein
MATTISINGVPLCFDRQPDENTVWIGLTVTAREYELMATATKNNDHIASCTLGGGDMITVTTVERGYEVECWDKEDNSRWMKFFTTRHDAMMEFIRFIV